MGARPALAVEDQMSLMLTFPWSDNERTAHGAGTGRADRKARAWTAAPSPALPHRLSVAAAAIVQLARNGDSET